MKVVRSAVFLVMSVLGCTSSTTLAADFEGGPESYLDLVARLGPGDTLHLSEGEYTGCLHLFGVHGVPGQPITITGPDTGPRPVFKGGSCVDSGNPRDSVIVFLRDASHIVIRNLELDAENQLVNGVRGGFGTTPVHNIVLEGLYIHDNDVNNQPSGISSFSTAWNWTIRNNHIERTGLGMYLGDSDGSDPFIGGTIENNLVVDPRGYGIQIKHQNRRVDVDGMPRDDQVTYIRHNVIIKASNAGTQDAARPNLLVGDFPPDGVGSSDRYEIYGNLLFENQSGSEALFQGEGRLSFHDNVLVNSFAGPGVVVRPHNGGVRVADIFRNTILTVGIGISISGAEISDRVEGNVVFANGMPGIFGGTLGDNIVGTLMEASGTLVDPTPVLGQFDPYPSRSSVVRGATLDWSAYGDHADIEVDFNGVARDGTWRGAYAGAGTNPGWRLAAENKPPFGVVPSDLDAGFVEDAAASSSSLDSGIGVLAPDAASIPPKTGVGGGCRSTDGSLGWAVIVSFGGMLLRRRSSR